jgi:hypothetical protein
MGNPLNLGDISSSIPGQVKKVTKRYFKLKTRTRLLLVFFGSVATISGWFLPWYTVNYFLTVNAMHTVVDGNHFVAVAQLSGADDLIKKYGENIAQNEYSGEDLAKAGFIRVPQEILYWWLGVVAVTLLAIKIDDLRVYGKVVAYLKRGLDLAKILTLLLQIGWVLWYCVQSTQLGWIYNAARTGIVHALGGTSQGILYISPGLSTGLMALILGLILCSLGVFSGNKDESINANVPTAALPDRFRLTAEVCATIGIVYFIFAVVTSTGKFPH